MIYPGEYTVTLEFSGIITRGMTGLYTCFFDVDGAEHSLLMTQFESHHAREAFPCIDEPEAKATFDLTLTTEPDVSVLGNTPITFPIDWHNSKIPGFALRADVPSYHNISAFVVMSSVAARFFPPQVAGAGATIGASGLPFRIDHDERFNQTTHVQYQMPFQRGPWIGLNWRFDSGLTAGSVPCYNDTGDPNSPCGASSLPDGTPAIDLKATGLTPDQELQAGLACNGVKATPTVGLPDLCAASELTSKLVSIPAPNTENDDKNPPRIAPRNLFDASIGEDNLFKDRKNVV